MSGRGESRPNMSAASAPFVRTKDERRILDQAEQRSYQIGVAHLYNLEQENNDDVRL